jgi:outer membrane protein TolC
MPPSGTAPEDSLHLSRLVADALRVDPRQQQLTLQARYTAMRLTSINAERLPGITGLGQAQYQNQVVRIPQIRGFTILPPPYDTYDAHVELSEPVIDFTRGPRRTLERAQLAENEAGVRVTVYTLRSEVDQDFFTAADDRERLASMVATIADLEGRLAEARERFRAGSALAGDTADIAATLLQRIQDSLQLHADERAARDQLAQLVGHPLPDSAPLALPGEALTAVADSVRATLAAGREPRDRPEFAQYDATRARLAAQEEQTAAAQRPKLTAYVHGGIGRPGLDLLSRAFQGYWEAGVNVSWSPFNWGTNQRDRQELEVQQQIAATNDSAFAQNLRRTVESDLATVARLEPTLAVDDSIVALREVTLREARAQLDAGALTSASYLDRSTDLLSARLTRTEHRVTLAQARVHLLTTLGLELPSSQ